MRGSEDGGGRALNAGESEAVERTTESKMSCGGDGCKWQGKGFTSAPSP
jgi:hypothetical protein